MLDPVKCPFCMTMPIVNPQDPEEDGDAWAEVCCVNDDGCPVKPIVSYYDDDILLDSDLVKEAAIKKWNMAMDKKIEDIN